MRLIAAALLATCLLSGQGTIEFQSSRVPSGVTRSAQDKLDDFISVFDYGVANDGKTDSTVKFQAAINAAQSAGKTLYCPSLGNPIVVSRTGTRTLSFDGIAHFYSLLITSPLTIKGDCTLTINIADSTTASVLWAEGANVSIEGLSFVGTGVNSTSPHFTAPCITSTGTQCLYNGAAILFNSCDNCSASGISTTNMRDNTLAFTSVGVTMRDSFSSIPIGNFAGAHFAAYSSIGVTIDNVTGYGGTADGDVYIYGNGAGRTLDLPGIGSVISNSHLYNYVFGDLTRTISTTSISVGGGQGFMCDGGGAGVRIEHNYAYGYFLPFDVKAACSNGILADNEAEKCAICFSSRYGEDRQPVTHVSMIGNKAWPEGGIPGLVPTAGGLEGNSLNADTCFYLQDSYDADLEANTCGPIGSANVGTVPGPGSYTDNFYCLWAETDLSAASSLQVQGVKFDNNTCRMNDVLAGGTGVQSTLAAVWIVATSGPVIRSVDLVGNHIRPIGGATQELIHVEQAQDVTFEANNIEHYQGNYPVVHLVSVTNFNGVGNLFDQSVQILQATSSSHLVWSNNNMLDSLLDSMSASHPTLYSDNSSFWTVIGNAKLQTSTFHTDGIFFSTNDGDACPAASSPITLSNNTIQAVNYPSQTTRICGNNDYNSLYTVINNNTVNGVPTYLRTKFFPNPSSYVQVGTQDGISQLGTCQWVFADASGTDQASICEGSGVPAFTAPEGSIYLENDGASAVPLWVRHGGTWTAVIDTLNGVESFNTRVGNVLPATGDYNFGMITGTISASGGVITGLATVAVSGTSGSISCSGTMSVNSVSLSSAGVLSGTCH